MGCAELSACCVVVCGSRSCLLLTQRSLCGTRVVLTRRLSVVLCIRWLLLQVLVLFACKKLSLKWSHRRLFLSADRKSVV